MEILLENVIWFVIIFIVIFLMFHYYLVKMGMKTSKDKVPPLVAIILYRHEIDIHKINYKHMLLEISIYTALVFALVTTICFYFIKSYILAGFVIFFVILALCLMIYHLIGIKYEKLTKEVIEEKKEANHEKKEKNRKKMKKNN